MDFNKARDQFRQAFAHVRDDWERSKEEATLLWTQASSAARKVRTLSEEVATEVRVDLKLVLKSLQAQLISQAFEAHLDEILRASGLEEKFKAQSPLESDDRWFARVHASLCEDELTDDGSKESLRVRRERIGRKLGFLFRHYRDDVMDSAKTGAMFGGILGPRTAIRLAMIAGGMKLVFIVGGVTYTVLVKENGDWSLA